MDAVQSSSAAYSKIPALPRLRRIQEPLRSAQYTHLIATPTQPPRYLAAFSRPPRRSRLFTENLHGTRSLRGALPWRVVESL